jgi:hypothetical protein
VQALSAFLRRIFGEPSGFCKDIIRRRELLFRAEREGEAMRTLRLILCIWLVSVSAAAGQSKAYAKFNDKGSTVGLYNLLAETGGCEEGRVISGMITKVTFDVGESSYSYTFTIEANGRRRAINIRICNGEILRPDVENIIVPRRWVRILARRCENAEVWAAEEIRRL